MTHALEVAEISQEWIWRDARADPAPESGNLLFHPGDLAVEALQAEAARHRRAGVNPTVTVAVSVCVGSLARHGTKVSDLIAMTLEVGSQWGQCSGRTVFCRMVATVFRGFPSEHLEPDWREMLTRRRSSGSTLS